MVPLGFWQPYTLRYTCARVLGDSKQTGGRTVGQDLGSELCCYFFHVSREGGPQPDYVATPVVSAPDTGYSSHKVKYRQDLYNAGPLQGSDLVLRSSPPWAALVALCMRCPFRRTLN